MSGPIDFLGRGVYLPNIKFLKRLEIPFCLLKKLVSRQGVVAHACSPSLGR